MPSPMTIDLLPGYVKTDSPLAASGRYVDGDNVRFYRDRPQKVGGNVALLQAPLDNPVRGMFTWGTGSSRQFLAAGTADKLYAIPSDTFAVNDITPAGLDAGLVDPIYGYGWSIGGWSQGAWSAPRTESNALFQPRIWSFGNFGRILLASPSDRGLYSWDPDVFPAVSAALVAGAPSQMRGFWQTAERFTLCFGCTGPLGENVDYMRVSWSAQGDFTDWSTTHTPAQLAQLPGAPAGSRTLQFGEKIVGAADLGNAVSLIWSDAALYSWQYVGGAFTFSSQLIGVRCGLLSRYAFAIAAGDAYWISSGNFWMYTANGIGPMPNSDDISEWFFARLSQFQAAKSFAFYNVRFSEVWFVIVPNGVMEPALAAVYNTKGQFWFHCSLARSAATSFSQLDPSPVLGGSDGGIYRHEDGVDNNGAIMPWSLTTSFLEMEDGVAAIDITGFMPDMERQFGNIIASITALDRTPQVLIDTESETFDNQQGMVDFRLSGRELQLSLAGSMAGSDFRLGKSKIEFQQTGRRR